MRQVTKKDLARMKKRGGVKVKRRLGTGKLESEAKGSSVLSGIAKAEAPAPASLPEVLPPPVAPDIQGMAAMAASLAARDAQLQAVVENNTRVVKDFQKSLVEIAKPKKRVPWDHHVIRNKGLLIERVRSTPVET